ncbi:MAG: TetR/AcrR family transcriptional regulator [Candidatus Dormibacteraeota bacterium]|nr:TetR/AcrR family transcriptional regulator [Candidatus Dormibacteraeota bacterium]
MTKAVKRKRNYNASLRQEQALMTRQRIRDAARRLLTQGTYSSVTMEEIAQEAGVAYQTVYATFGSKLQLAKDVIEEGFHFEAVEELAARANAASDPEDGMRIGAELTRRIHEICADLLRFMRESGDPELLARYHQSERMRLSQQAHIPALLQRSGRLQPGLSESEVAAVLWAMTGTEFYSMLVFQQGWSPSRYEDWLGTALIEVLLVPAEEVRAPT